MRILLSFILALGGATAASAQTPAPPAVNTVPAAPTAATYAARAVEALKAHDNPRAVALATASLGLQDTVNARFVRGLAYANQQNFAAASVDLEVARTRALAGHANPASMKILNDSLVSAYLFSGQGAKGLALAQEVRAADPADTRVDESIALYYANAAQTLAKTGDINAALTRLEEGAAAAPGHAVDLYVSAATVASMAAKPDWNRVRVEADKALVLAPDNPAANYALGIAEANVGDRSGGLAAMRRAKAHEGADAALNSQIDDALKRLTP
jgi:tetratricopeptide (TPR) repeat protein